MIPLTDDDRIRLKIYDRLEKTFDKLSSSEFALLFKTAYEKEKYTKYRMGQHKSGKLEEELLILAYTYLNTPEDKRRQVDVRALKIIKKRNNCKGTDPVAVGFFRNYNAIKNSLGDLMNGIAYIEDQLESDGRQDFEGFEDNSLEGELVKLALTYKGVHESKQRKIDYQAFGLIKRCSSCRNSSRLIRYYYRFYKDMTEES